MKIRFALLLPLLLVACTSNVAPGESPRSSGGDDALAQVGHWNLQSATDAKGQVITAAFPNGSAVHSLVFADGVLGIKGGCNHIGGRYRIDAQGRLLVPEIETTLKACADQALLGADAAVSGLLQGTSRWRIAESYPEQLFMDHADGKRSSWVAAR
jgi:heat shock protein HslJ